MRIQEIKEAAAMDYFRKLDALDAMIADKAATPGEKENAAALKAKIEQKLATEHPGAKRPSQADKDYLNSDEFRAAKRWADEYERQQKEYQRWEDAKKPGANRDFVKVEIENLKARRKHEMVGQSFGNVESNEAVKRMSARIDDLYATYFPEEWETIQAKRRAANDKASERNFKKRQEKVATMTVAAKESGLSFSEAARGHEEVLKKIYKLVTGQAYKKKAWGGLADSVFAYMEHVTTKNLRVAFAALSAEEQAELIGVVKSIHTKGFVGHSYDDSTNNGYTEAQKIKVLKGMDILKQANGMTYKQFEAKWDPVLASVTYKPGRSWSKSGQPVENPVDFIGSSGNNKAAREYAASWLEKLLDDQQRADMRADLKMVNPTTPAEERIVFGMKSLLTTEDDQGDGLTWDQFKEKFKDVIETVKYKRDRWEKDDSLFDIFGKSANGYAENEKLRHIAKLSKEQKAELLAGLAEVAPKNAVEKARVKRLTTYFEN